MGTAPKKSRAARQLARRAAEVDLPASMEFVIYEDNGGAYHWRIVTDDGATIGQSGDFASYDDAKQAARQVRDGAASARFELRATEPPPVALIARRDASSDDSGAMAGATLIVAPLQQAPGDEPTMLEVE